MALVLIVEDEADMADVLKDNLELEGYAVLCARNGIEGLDLALQKNPDCVILDVMLPGKNGFEVCRELRAREFVRPIIMLTAKSQESDKVRGLELGADDYVTKPFGLQELMARVRVVLRRPVPLSTPVVLKIGHVEVNLKNWRLKRGCQEIPLTTHEAKLLELLGQSPGKVFSRDEILNAVWGLDAYPSNRTVDNFIVKLRKKIEPCPQQPCHLITVHGSGYKLEL